jgi:hypothetical protein
MIDDVERRSGPAGANMDVRHRADDERRHGRSAEELRQQRRELEREWERRWTPQNGPQSEAL